MSKNINFLLAISPEDGQAHFWRCVRAASFLAKKNGTIVCVYLPENDLAHNAVKKFQTNDDAPIAFHFLNDMTPPPQGKVHFTPFSTKVLNYVQPSDVLIIDTYRAMDADILKRAKADTKTLILVDDFDIKGIKGGCADTVLNVCLPEKAVKYNPSIVVLAPPHFHLTSPDCFVQREKKPGSVFVSFSGADRGDVATSFFKALNAINPDLCGEQYTYTVFVKNINEKAKKFFNELTAKHPNRIKVVNAYDGQTLHGSYDIHIGNPGSLAHEFACAGAKIAGIAALSEMSPSLKRAFEGQGIPFEDLTGILDGKNRSSEMLVFAHSVDVCLRNDGGVTVARPNPKGMQSFCNYVLMRCC